eukprot:GHVU01002160.1.p1 GENE.GHVU01002160.1~~GHVU01002160.1.p1  ORF type:complete len:368 (+),score=35.50 GHVU01002160.1:110-1105(+)
MAEHSYPQQSWRPWHQQSAPEWAQSRRAERLRRGSEPMARVAGAHALSSDELKAINNAYKAIKGEQKSLDTSDECGFDNAMGMWGDTLKEFGAEEHHVKHLLARSANSEISEVIRRIGADIHRMHSNEVVDEVARAMFPGSEWMEEVIEWLNGWKPQGTVRGAIRLVKETIHRYQRLVTRHGRGVTATERMRKKWLVKKLRVAAVDRFLGLAPLLALGVLMGVLGSLRVCVLASSVGVLPLLLRPLLIFKFFPTWLRKLNVRAFVPWFRRRVVVGISNSPKAIKKCYDARSTDWNNCSRVTTSHVAGNLSSRPVDRRLPSNSFLSQGALPE